MKQKDIMLIAVIVIIASVLSYLVAGKLFDDPKNYKQKISQVDPISSTFPNVAETGEISSLVDYFNKDSINPTGAIQIGIDANDKPFNAKP
jgi:predicted permease